MGMIIAAYRRNQSIGFGKERSPLEWKAMLPQYWAKAANVSGFSNAESIRVKLSFSS